MNNICTVKIIPYLLKYKFLICFNLHFRVEHLIEGHNYNFRVKAVNKIGESLPLTGQSPITAKDPYKKPDKPGTPVLKGKLNLSATFYFLHL